MNPSIRRDARALGATHRFPCLTNTIRLAVLVVLLLAVGGCENMICWNYEEPREVGLKAYQQQRYADAAGAFRVAINKNSCDYESYYYLGCSLQSLRAYHEAIENYKASLDVMKVTYAGRMDMDFRLKTMDALASAIVHGDNHDAELTTMEDQARRQQSVWDYYELGKIYRLRGHAELRACGRPGQQELPAPERIRPVSGTAWTTAEGPQHPVASRVH